jgi:hypothetical protein
MIGAPTTGYFAHSLLHPSTHSEPQMQVQEESMLSSPEALAEPNQERPGPIAMDTKAAAAFIGLAPKTLENDRRDGRFGIPFVRISKNAVRYRRADLEAFVQSCLVHPQRK